ncbi:hypothetical protein [Halochromatium glycolicum]|uniref:hypothetical protein n=1 Tax=Halochromatium glycolicum TaxID=85075 RepID=UPI00190A808A|nr:hypothetical protein [Halochromatium glycolicum]
MMEETEPGAWIVGDVKTFFEREVKPHVPDAWIDGAATKIGYEISFIRWFYKPKPLRTLAEIRADIEAEQRRTEGLLEQILVDIDGDADTPVLLRAVIRKPPPRFATTPPVLVQLESDICPVVFGGFFTHRLRPAKAPTHPSGE